MWERKEKEHLHLQKPMERWMELGADPCSSTLAAKKNMGLMTQSHYEQLSYRDCLEFCLRPSRPKQVSLTDLGSSGFTTDTSKWQQFMTHDHLMDPTMTISSSLQIHPFLHMSRKRSEARQLQQGHCLQGHTSWNVPPPQLGPWLRLLPVETSNRAGVQVQCLLGVNVRLRWSHGRSYGVPKIEDASGDLGRGIEGLCSDG